MARQASQHHDLDDPPRSDSCRLYSSTQTVGALTSVSRGSFLDGMRQVATAVTVVTTDGPGGRHGATVSAFASVSADPPTILVCLRNSSRICSAVRRNGVFTVNVLAEQDCDVARAFAGDFDDARENRFEGLSLVTVADLAPGIAGATIFACAIAEVLLQHTHTIVIGQVGHVVTTHRPPLLYHDAAYRRLPDSAA